MDFRIHYNKILLRRYFLIWKRKTIETRRSAKMEIRARIHYEYRLKRNVMKKWQILSLKSIIKRAGKLIAVRHYNNKLEKKYFNLLRVQILKDKFNRILSEKLMEKIVICCMLLEVYIYEQKYGDIKLLVLMKKYYQSKWVLRTYKIVLYTWINYGNYKRQKRENEKKLKEYQKRKYNPEKLRIFFEKWRIFTINRKSDKISVDIANDYYRTTLLRNAFNKLVKYNKYRKEKYLNSNEIDLFYNIKVCRKYLDKWVLYCNHQKNKQKLIIQATIYYENKIKEVSMIKLYNYTKWCKKKRLIINMMRKRTEKHLLCKYFQNLKRYVVYRNQKRNKSKLALIFSNNKLQRKYFVMWIRFLENAIRRNMYNDHLRQKFMNNLQSRLLKEYFKKWLNFAHQQTNLKNKLRKAIEFHQHNLLLIIIKKWKLYVLYKTQKTRRINFIVLKVNFIKWRNYVHREKALGEKLLVAKRFYVKQQKLAAIEIIVKLGSKMLAEKNNTRMNIIEKELRLAEKYFALWKNKTSADHTEKYRRK